MFSFRTRLGIQVDFTELIKIRSGKTLPISYYRPIRGLALVRQWMRVLMAIPDLYQYSLAERPSRRQRGRLLMGKVVEEWRGRSLTLHSSTPPQRQPTANFNVPTGSKPITLLDLAAADLNHPSYESPWSTFQQLRLLKLLFYFVFSFAYHKTWLF